MNQDEITPLDISCEQALHLMETEKQGNLSFIEESLLKEHLRICEKCQKKRREDNS